MIRYFCMNLAQFNTSMNDIPKIKNLTMKSLGEKDMFNFGQPEPGDIEKLLKPRRSSFIAMNCEARNFMFGFMMAPKHPYAVVVKEDGSYSIDNVPPGDYTVKAWHPRFGIKKAKLSVSENGTAETISCKGA